MDGLNSTPLRTPVDYDRFDMINMIVVDNSSTMYLEPASVYQMISSKQLISWAHFDVTRVK